MFEVDAFDPVVQAMADLLCPRLPDDAFSEVELGFPNTALLDAAAVRLGLLQRQIGALQAEQLQLMAHLDAGDESAEHWVSDLVACILRVSVPTAKTKLVRARKLAEQLPATLAQVAAGDIPAWYADTIVAECSDLPDELLPEYEARVLKRAATQTMTQLRQVIRRAKTALDPRQADQKRVEALAHRMVTTRALDDGLAQLTLVHSAEVIQAVMERICSVATLLPREDPRMVAQQRADLIVDGVLAGLPLHDLPTAQRIHPTVQVVVTAGTLLGVDDEPGWLAGYGPITAEHARTIAADPTGTWRRILLDPDTHHVLDFGAATYRPSAHLIRYLSARDATCVFPPCERPAHRSEVDHTTPFDRGGPTIPANTAITCRRHNNIKKQENGWSYTHDADGSRTWTHQPTGLTFDSHAPERWQPSQDPGPPPF